MKKTGFYLFKFFEKKEYLDDFIKGLMFCNTGKWFENAEETSEGVKDFFEGKSLISIADETHLVQHRIVERDGQCFIEFEEPKEKYEGYKDNMLFIAESRMKYNIFCMSMLYVDENHNVIDFNKDNCKNFGEYGVFIKNIPEFFNRVKSALLKNDSEAVYAAPVHYIEYSKRQNIQQWTPFNKFANFSAQNEFRFVFANKKDDILQYHIGNIEDIIEIIYNKKFFYEANSNGKALVLNSNEKQKTN